MIHIGLLIRCFDRLFAWRRPVYYKWIFLYDGSWSSPHIGTLWFLIAVRQEVKRIDNSVVVNALELAI